ncbi:hypothetical protein EDC96DRAFT_476642 [Choanephora cucurbitarum]|nr:hypothetical protein EDC96DRAFT_476642 [Choanephora cucurbitarum]
MSSVSSFEGSDQRSFIEGSSSSLRHSYLRKTDLLDTFEVGRLRDTDTWSVAATIDDQESVISTHGGPPSIIKHLHDMHLNDNNTNLRDLVENKHLLRSVGGSILDDEDDKRSRSNAAEFGDDGARSATADFDHSVESGEEDNVVDDEIVAPPQPQPSFASITKSYAELMEENEILQTQLRNAQLAQKHQADMISHLKNLTGCNDEVYGKALDLSHFYVSLPQDQAQASPIVNARTLTQKLARLAETLTRFVHATVDEEWRLTLEQSLFLQITQLYLSSLPFGTENQDLLNTAYSDQIRRFHSTLGANFAKWYRRQTVQSLSLNPATKEYLHDMRNHLTDEMLRLLTTMTKRDKVPVEHMHMWDDILELCAALSLEIHGGDADVTAQIIGVGSKFDEEIMALVGDSTATKDRRVGMVISPLFVDEEEVVLLPARVVLEQ